MPAADPVKPCDIHASVVTALGIDPLKEVMTPLDRPMTLIKKDAVPIKQLFA